MGVKKIILVLIKRQLITDNLTPIPILFEHVIEFIFSITINEFAINNFVVDKFSAYKGRPITSFSFTFIVGFLCRISALLFTKNETFT